MMEEGGEREGDGGGRTKVGVRGWKGGRWEEGSKGGGREVMYEGVAMREGGREGRSAKK